MFKLILTFLLILVLLVFPKEGYAQESSFVSIVNPVRGQDFWESKNSRPIDAVLGQVKVLKEVNLPATWLVRPDVLQDPEILSIFKSFPSSHEIGIFLEITPSWANMANIKYRSSQIWHLAGSAFLTGYSPSEREKLIDAVFINFKKIFGFYPQSVGAWYIDSYSLGYMQKKYGVTSALIVSDQYTTDNYQIWGQYWSTPYYPSKKNVLIPAQNVENKLPVVIMQWAARDPVNGYGRGVEDSTYSIQPNDYIDYHGLNIGYFSKMIDLFTTQKFNQFNQLVVGLENSYSWQRYGNEYAKQIQNLVEKKSQKQLSLSTMKEFSNWYQLKYPGISPPHIIVANDPLGSEKKAIWYMNPYYRLGWFYNQDGSVIRDIRQYIEGQTEPCFDIACNELNFATFSTRVLDDVTYGQKLLLDQGKIKNLEVKYQENNFLISYYNEAEREKQIKLMPRDISIDGKVSTIDGLILQTITTQPQKQLVNFDSNIKNRYQQNIFTLLFQFSKFLLFIFVGLFIPGFILVRLLKQASISLNLFLSIIIGFVNLVLITYFLSYFTMQWLSIVYIIFNLVIFLVKKYYKELSFRKLFFPHNIYSTLVVLLIFGGIIFQSLSMIRSGWVYDYGVGFWGPLGHDGIWHQSLISQLLKQVPPENPALSGNILSNYHYFYDLLIATTIQISQIPTLDLLYRFYPVLFSLLLGWGTYLLSKRLFNSNVATLASLYFVYFTGSFGWIVEFLREKHFGGESAFWVNQPISMNLNPPFAISLIIIIATVLVLQIINKKKTLIGSLLLILLVGSLMEFKVYAGIIVLGSLFIVAIIQIISKKNFSYLGIFALALFLSLIVFLPQNSNSGQLLIYSPFWFIHSMIDFPDRVGWQRLSQARFAYTQRGDLFKLFLAEGLALGLFIIGNLGIRFLALFTIPTFFKKGLWRVSEYSFLFFLSLLALVIPIIFIQKGNPWNTIQFFYYFLFTCALYAGMIFTLLYQKIMSSKMRFLKIVGMMLIVLILIITPINAVVTFRSSLYLTPPSRLSLKELDALYVLSSLPDGAVLTYPFDKTLRSKFTDPYPLLVYETTSYVSAFSGKSTYIEDEIQQEILQNDYKKRLVKVNDFFRSKDINWSKEFLSINKIRYIYLPKVFDVHLNLQELNIDQVYSNEEVIIYKVS